MSEVTVLIVADSRGRLLKAQLNKVFYDIPYSLYWKKSLSLQETAEFIAPTIINMRPKLIYLLNGICDITYINLRDPWSVALQYPTVTATVDNNMAALDITYSQIYALSDQLCYKPMILPVTQTGIKFRIYNRYPDDLVSPSQVILDSAINKINRNIVELHQSMYLSLPILASAAHSRCRGKYRFVKSKLLDGCHPTSELCFTWAKRLHKNAVLNLESYDYYSLVNQMYN